MNIRVCKAPVKVLFVIFLFLQLVACGGGGGSESSNVSVSSNNNNTPEPVAPSALNTAPTLAGTPATSVTVGNVYSFQPVAFDKDGNVLVFSIKNSPKWASFDKSTGRLTGTPTAGDVGNTGGIVISVSDGIASASTARFSIRVDQANVIQSATNIAPTLTGTPLSSVIAGSAYSFQPVAADSNNDPLTFSIQNRPVWASFNSSTGLLSGTPTASNVGSFSNIVITVSDGVASTSIAPFSIRVDSNNTAPSLSGTPATRVMADAVYRFQPVSVDVDGDALTFSIQNRPVWASFNSSTGLLSGTPTASNVGSSDNIVISVSDGLASAALASFSIRVDKSNNAPTLSGTAAASVIAGDAYSFHPVAADSDGDTLTFSIQNRPVWASFNSTTGRLSGTPTDSDVGSASNIVISVSDGVDSAAIAPFSIRVDKRNSAPTLSGTPDTNVTVGKIYSFLPVATDVDGDTLIFSIQNLPVWASFNSTTGRLSGTPTDSDVGSVNNIVISVTDGIDSASLAPFSISVDAAPKVNSAPTLSGTPKSSVTAGTWYSFLPEAADSDGDTLKFSIKNRPAWANFNVYTGRVTGTPSDSDVGSTDNIEISVSDGVDSVALAPFSISVVAAAAGNSAPTLSGIPLTSVAAGNAYSFQPSAIDSDADPLTFSIQNRPVWASFNSTTGRLSGTPTVSDIGSTASIIITVSDGVASASLAAFTISVKAAAKAERKYHPGHYVTMYRSDGASQMIAAIKPGLVGMQRIYNWRELDTSKYVNGVLVSSYDFSKIQADLDLLTGQGMRLIIRVSDKTFSNDYPTPLYLQGPEYTQPNSNANGKNGYTAVRWNPFVVARFNALLTAMGKQFDGQANFEGIGVPETALGFDTATLNNLGYTAELYRDALISVLTNAAQSFPNSQVFWYMNFLIRNQSYIGDIATAVAPYGVAMGGPDVLPDNTGLVDRVYPFYTQFKGKMKLFGSMQNDSYREEHKDTTKPTKYWTMDEMFRFARDQLHVNYVFWNRVASPTPADSNEWKDSIPVIGAYPTFNLN